MTELLSFRFSSHFPPKKMINTGLLGSAVGMMILIVVMLGLEGWNIYELTQLPRVCITDCSSQIEVTLQSTVEEANCTGYCAEACTTQYDCPTIVFKDMTAISGWNQDTDSYKLTRACLIGQCTYHAILNIANQSQTEVLATLGLSHHQITSFEGANFTLSTYVIDYPFEIQSAEYSSGGATHPVQFMCRNLMSPNQTEIGPECLRVQTEELTATGFGGITLTCRYWVACLSNISNFLTNSTAVFPSMPLP